MRKLSPMIWLKLRRRCNGWPTGGGSGGGPNNSGMVAAVVHAPSDSRRTSFIATRRPSRFHSARVSRSTGPYSFPSTRTTHRSDIGRLIAKEQLCHPAARRRQVEIWPQQPQTGAGLAFLVRMREINQSLPFHETAFDRWALLCLPLVFRHSESKQFAR